jgi:Tat protein secretion system quality control protein TatD with DNase activity
MKANVHPNTIPIKLHCFLGNRSDVTEWMEAFPNVLFSFGTKSLDVDRQTGKEHLKAARSLHLDQILVESDAPYLGRLRRETDQFGNLLSVGQWLGFAMGLDTGVILANARMNAIRAFDLPPM